MTTILPRRGTAAQWTAANPVLAMGEEGYETDTTRWKRGDGVTAWTALAYYQPAWSDVTAKPAVIAAGTDQAEARAVIGAVGNGELVFNVKDYGAVGDGVTDDTAAIQAASIDAHAASALGSGVYFPPGNYVLTSAIDITKSLNIFGSGSSSTSLISKTAVSDAINVSANHVNIYDIYFQCQADISTATSLQPVAVRFTSGNFGTINRCYFAGWYISASFESCGSWIFRDNYVSRAVMYNLYVANTALPDSGDQVVSGNYFAVGGSYNTTAHIHQVSAGGLRLEDNKVLQGQIGFQLAVADGVNTSILVAVGNSFEYQTVSAIQLKLSGAANTGTFQKIIIGHNQITGNSCSSPVIDIVPEVAERMWSIMVDGNLISGTAGSTTFLRARNVNDLGIMGNQFFTGAIGLTIESTVTNVFVDSTNKMQSVTTPVSNSSPSPVVNSMWGGLLVTPPSGTTSAAVYVNTKTGTPVFTIASDNGNTLCAGGLRVGGNYQNIASLYITPTNTAPGAIIKSGGGTQDLLQFQDQSTTSLRLRVDQYGHIVYSGMGTPAISAGVGAGTSPTVAVVAGSSDSAGQIDVTIGTAPSSGNLVSITFVNAFPGTPKAVTLTPCSSPATTSQFYVSARSATGFTINLATAPSPGASMSWLYHVDG